MERQLKENHGEPVELEATEWGEASATKILNENE